MLKKIELHWQILIALILSVLFGMYLPDYVWYVEWMGILFLKALKMIIVPLILASIVSGITGIAKASNLGRLGLKTFSYYIMTSLFAIVTGLIMVNIIKPGVGADVGLERKVEGLTEGATLSDTLMNIIPENIFQAMVNADMLSIIFFAIIFGFFATRIHDKYSKPIINLFNGLFEVMMKITMFVIRFTPLGIFGIVAAVIAENSDALLSLFGSMGLYMLTVIASLAIHATITLPLIMRFVARANPGKHFKNMTVPLLTAFSTSSSNATLPLTLEAVEQKSGVSNKTTGFVLPLGATVNMDGTALYECVAALFIAQAYGVELSILQQGIVVFTALLASIGAAGIPMAGLVIITIILSAVGLPLEGVGLILAVDRILDMFRTSINVWSDSCGAVLIAKSEGEKLNV
ncbi:MAG: dicarboxylate/amino acid:cation symporter [Bacteroidales bacterium]